MVEFYKNAGILDELRELTNPTADDLNRLLDIIANDTELTFYFYSENANAAWIRLVKDAGEFEELGGSEEEIGIRQSAQAKYLARVAEKRPEEVLEIFTGIESLSESVRGDFINALLNMPPECAVKGVPIVLGYLEGREPKEWYFVCYHSAKLMSKLAEKYPDEAFALAETLLEVWGSAEKKTVTRDIESKFRAFEYEKILFDFYSKLWEVDAYRSTKLLINLLNEYINELQSGKDYEVTTLWYINYERLDQMGSRLGRDILASLIAAICQVGKTVAESEGRSTERLLKLLQGLDKQIFRRIEMYLLRFVATGTQQDGISDIIRDVRFLGEPGFKYEYRLLLHNKFEDIDQDARQTFEDWVKAKKLTDDHRQRITEWYKEREDREATDKDFERIENSNKAEALYMVRDKFPELYEECKSKSGATDAELAPQPRLTEGRMISPSEGTPISAEEMNKMPPLDVLAYIQDDSNWKDQKHTSVFNTPQEGLEGAFQEDVLKRASDYAALEPSELIKLKPEFLSRYFHGIDNALREKKIETASLVAVLEQASEVVKDKQCSGDYRGSFAAILYITTNIFDDDGLKEGVAKAKGELLWGIIEPLTKYDCDPDSVFGSDTDPHTESINSVQGRAFELAVRFGLIFKNDDAKNYARIWSGKIKNVLAHIVDDVKTPKTMCVFGVWLPQLHWSEEEWLKDNVDKILDTENDETWETVWGAYMSWARPSKNVFDFLAEQGKYDHAIGRIGSTTKYTHSKDPDEGLVEHLMTAFFQAWIELENDLLTKFLAKAPGKLRGKAAGFLTTGFAHLAKNANEVTSKRLKQYWQMRLSDIAKEPATNIEETVEFIGWIKDTPLDRKETFDLLHKTLQLTDGKLGEGRSVYDFMDGTYDAAEGHELMALRCMNAAIDDEHMAMYFSLYQEKAMGFMKSIVALPDDYADVQEIRREAIRLADAYGRKRVHELRSFYEELSKMI